MSIFHFSLSSIASTKVWYRTGTTHVNGLQINLKSGATWPLVWYHIVKYMVRRLFARIEVGEDFIKSYPTIPLTIANDNNCQDFATKSEARSNSEYYDITTRSGGVEFQEFSLST